MKIDNQKGFAEFIIILIVAVVALSLIGFNLYKSGRILTTPPQETSPAPVSTPDETSDWKTYTDKDSRFAFQYPEKYEIIIFENGVAGFFNNQSDYDDCNEYLENKIKSIDNPCLKIKFSFNGYSKYTSSKSAQEVEKEHSFSPDGKLTYIDSTKRTWVTDYLLAEVFNYSAYTRVNDNYHVVSFQNKEDNREFFDQILSTFKFTGKENLINRINFKVKIPDNWTSEVRIIDREETLYLKRKVSDTQLVLRDRYPTEVFIGYCSVYSGGCTIGANSNGYRGEFDAFMLGENKKAQTATKYFDADKKVIGDTEFQIDLNHIYPFITGRFFSEKERKEILQILSSFEYL